MSDEIVIKKSSIIRAVVAIGIAIGSFVAGFMVATLLGLYSFS